MITSFNCKATQALFSGARVARFVNIQIVAMRKLQQLHAATTLSFLRVPPNNMLKSLEGDRVGRFSIRINDQWRICFRFDAGHATEVEIVDYH